MSGASPARTVRIGTRGSPLALWQANWVRERLAAIHRGVSFEIVTIRTAGDQDAARPLSAVDARGIFTREIERALLDGRVDVAVHSMKDLPTDRPDGLVVAAIPQRDDPREALIARSARSLEGLPEGARVVAGSPRRKAQLLHVRPDLRIVDIRGNIATRLTKFDRMGADAMILARAGLIRLGLEKRIAAPLDPADFLPAAGQGALAIQIRRTDSGCARLAAPLDHPEARAAVTAERAFLRRLGGGCRVPIAALARVENGRLRLDGLVASADGSSYVRDQAHGEAAEPEKLGRDLADSLLAAGAGDVLEQAAREQERAKA